MFSSRAIALVVGLMALSMVVESPAKAGGPDEAHGTAGAGVVVVENADTTVRKPTWEIGGSLIMRPKGSGIAPKTDDTHVTMGLMGGPAGGTLTLQMDGKIDGTNGLYISVGSDRIASLAPYINRGTIPIGIRYSTDYGSTFRVLVVPFAIVNDNVNNNNSVGSGMRLEYVADLAKFLQFGAAAEGLVTAGNTGSLQDGAGLAGGMNMFVKAKLGEHVMLKVEGVADATSANVRIGGGLPQSTFMIDRHANAGVHVAF